MVKTEIIASVREMLSRNLDCLEIAHRLHVDPITVQWAIDFINGMLT